MVGKEVRIWSVKRSLCGRYCNVVGKEVGTVCGR